MNSHITRHKKARAAAKRMLEREFNVRFLDKETEVPLPGGESWKADLVSEDLRIVAEVKAMTFWGRVGSKIRGLATACLLLAGVQAERKLLVLSDPEMVDVFKDQGKRYWKVAEALGVEVRQLTDTIKQSKMPTPQLEEEDDSAILRGYIVSRWARFRSSGRDPAWSEDV